MSTQFPECRFGGTVYGDGTPGGWERPCTIATVRSYPGPLHCTNCKVPAMLTALQLILRMPRKHDAASDRVLVDKLTFDAMCAAMKAVTE